MTFDWGALNKQRLFYEQWAKGHILELMRHHDVSYSELSDAMRLHGVVLSRRALTNKLHRGTYSFAFALQVLAALGETDVSIPKLPSELRRVHRPKPAPPVED